MDDQPEPRGKQLHTITSSLESRTQSGVLRKVQDSTDRKKLVAVSLAKLAAHYWRPDFTATQAEMLFEDFVEDLREFRDDEVEKACRLYRQDGQNQFFPKPGQLREILLKERAEENSIRKISSRALPDSRPIMWWLLDNWKPHWMESEIPADEVEQYRRRKADRIARDHAARFGGQA